MSKPQHCKIIGGVSLVLGIAVLIISSIFLNEPSRNKCVDQEEHDFVREHFEYKSETGGFHGGHDPSVHDTYDDDSNSNLDSSRLQRDVAYKSKNKDEDDDPYSPSKVNPRLRSPSSSSQTNYGNSHGHEIDQNEQKYLSQKLHCPSVINKYNICANVGIAVSIFQILLSTAYCFARKNTVKTLSLGWSATHFIIMAAMIAVAGVLLAQKTQTYSKRMKHDHGEDIFVKKLTFAIICLADAVILLFMLIYVGLTWKKSDYDDYSVEKTDQELISKKKLES